MLGIRSLRLRTCLAWLAHYHNGSWSPAPHDKWGSRALVHRGFCASSVHLYACDGAAVRCTERDRQVQRDKQAQPDDTMIQMSATKITKREKNEIITTFQA